MANYSTAVWGQAGTGVKSQTSRVFREDEPNCGGSTSSALVGKADETKSPTENPRMPKKDNVRTWSKKDVSRWLEKRHLVKFAPLFLRNGVVGSDLVDSKLSFLYDEEVSVEDREEILGEVYALLHPHTPTTVTRSAPSNSATTSAPILPIGARDREKYEAALQVAKSPSSHVSSAPVILIGQRSRSPAATLTSPTTLALPTSKPRSRSESGLEAEGEVSVPLTPPSPGRKYLKRKSTPAVHDYLQRGIVQNASLYDTLQDDGQVCLHCVNVQRSEVGSKFGFSYQTLPDNCLLVTNVRSSSLPLHIGDRIVEVNGILLPGHKGSAVDTVLAKSASLCVVVIRDVFRSREEDHNHRNPPSHVDRLQQQVVMNEVRWQSLRQLMTSLQQKTFDPLTLTGALSRVEDLDDMKKRATLEMEVEELTRNCTELSNKVNSLQASLKAKEEEMLSMKRERDRATDTLRKRLLYHCNPRHSSSDGRRGRRGGGGGGGSDGGGSDDDDDDVPRKTKIVESSLDLHSLFFEHIDLSLTSMEASDASKEDVLGVLRELTQATRRHAHFVDRLISLVCERAPWMIDELNALQDASELPDSPAEPSPTLTSSVSKQCDEERVIVV